MNLNIKKEFDRILLVRLVSKDIIDSVNHPYGYRFPFMLKYIEALLKKESRYRVEFIDTLIRPMSLGRLLEFSQDWLPRVIVIFSTTRESELTLKYATSIKKNNRETIIICIGQDATARPEKYIFDNSPIDIVLLGEAEIEVLNLIRNLKDGFDLGKLKKFYLCAAPFIVSKLDELPFPDTTLEELKKYFHIYPLNIKKRLVWGHILSSKGCPYSCIFCSQIIRESFGKEVRSRSACNVVDEIEYLIKRGANIVIFDDDNFTTSENHVINICNEIQKRKLKIIWTAHARIDNVTFDLLKTMRNAGCVLLRFGIESASNRILKILKKTDCNNWIQQSKEIFNFCKKLGINTVALFLIGNPTETKEEIKDSIKLARELEPDIIQVSLFTLYPGSEAFRQFEGDSNVLNTNKIYHYLVPEPALNLSALSSLELQEMHKVFYKDFLFNPKFLIEHFARYGLFYLYNLHILYRLLQITKYLIHFNSRKRYNLSDYLS